MEVSDVWVGTLLLAGLPNEYQPMVMGIESSGIAITADSIKTKILQDVKSESNCQNDVAFYGNKQNMQRYRPRCYDCNVLGHVTRNCPLRSKKDSNKSEESANLLSTSFAINCIENEEWLIDSGATSHT